jgi:hypothetical protein
MKLKTRPAPELPPNACSMKLRRILLAALAVFALSYLLAFLP